ncbi:MAG TPA: hypothetical protein VFQ53_23485 [Kofleriaceae bacterium]|nr:hypothetical protein [Kofleriaceae bacterium]
MSKRIVLALSLIGLIHVGSAFADDKSDAQAKVDAAKTETCEKSKKFLAEQDAKGKCRDENAEAKKVTCSASTFKQVSDLQTKCITAKPTADKPATPAATPKCRALDTKDKTNVFAEAEQKSQLKCLQLLIPELRKKWCTAENKGKKFDYMTDYDHTIGGKKIKGRKESITCKTVEK